MYSIGTMTDVPIFSKYFISLLQLCMHFEHLYFSYSVGFEKKYTMVFTY